MFSSFLQADIKKRLTREKKLFGTVSRSTAAKDLEKGGNVIDKDKSKELSSEAAQALLIFDAEKKYKGEISDAINAAALKIADGGNSKKIKDELYEMILLKINNAK